MELKQQQQQEQQQQQQQQQQQRIQDKEMNMDSNNSINNNDDYLQLLDAGEHMYGMFVGENEDLYAYLRSNEEQDCDYYHESSNESSSSIEEILSRNVDGLFLGGGVDVDVCFEQGTTNNETCCIDSNSEDERSATAGRVTPTKGIGEDHEDATIK